MSEPVLAGDGSVESNDSSSSGRPRGTNYLVAGGWLTIGAGVLALVNGLTAIFGEMYELGVWSEIPLDRYTMCGTVVIVFGVVAVVGGVAALKTRNMTLAFAGAALGVVGDGIIGFFMGLAAVALFFLSNEDL